jgi:GNAT superfamily N-acetyltransferase
MAVAADADELARMRYAFRASVTEPVEAEAEFVARCTPWMRSRLTVGGPWRCWVAVEAGQIRGHLWLCLLEKIPNPNLELEQHAYITNVYVCPEGRGGGLGRELLEAALAYCRDQHVDSVVLWPTERSRTLYARHGFVVPGDMMEAVLDEGRDLQ